MDSRDKSDAEDDDELEIRKLRQTQALMERIQQFEAKKGKSAGVKDLYQIAAGTGPTDSPNRLSLADIKELKMSPPRSPRRTVGLGSLEEFTDFGNQMAQKVSKRLLIDRIVLTNFKSFAGTQTIGPFHKVTSPSKYQMSSW